MNDSETVSTLSPQLLAREYDRFVSARWRGEDEAADPIALWFEAHWISEPSPEPESPPAGASILGASGRGIHWYSRGDHLFGYVPGHDQGCYRVAAAETIPPLTSPWDPEPAPRLGIGLVGRLIGRTAAESQSGETESGPGPAERQSQDPLQRDLLHVDRVLSQRPVSDPPGFGTSGEFRQGA